MTQIETCSSVIWGPGLRGENQESASPPEGSLLQALFDSRVSGPFVNPVSQTRPYLAAFEGPEAPRDHPSAPTPERHECPAGRFQCHLGPFGTVSTRIQLWLPSPACVWQGMGQNA